MSMNFIDIASWQGGMDLGQMFQSNPTLDGVIVKATGGTSYTNPEYAGWIKWLSDKGKPFGAYHYCRELTGNPGSPEEEARHFYNTIKPYIGSALPAADFEANNSDAFSKGTSWLKAFLDAFYSLSGVRPLVYCSQSVIAQFDFSQIAKSYKLWMAQYADNNLVYGFVEKPWHCGSVSPFNGYIMQQYTSHGRLNGWNENLDLDQFNGSYAEWLETARGEVGPVPPSHGADPVVISEVLAGTYGIGEERVRLLREDGYDPTDVQNKVNELYGIAQSCKRYTNGNEEYLNSIVKIIRSL